MLEKWKAIPGFNDVYEASDMGRIKRLKCMSPKGRQLKEKILSPCPTGDGHLQVGLNDGKKYTVHSLVLLAWVGPRPEGITQIRHLDDDPANNRLGNLAYGTPRENALDVRVNGGRAKPCGRRNAAILADLAGQDEWSYREMGDLARKHGVCATTVRRIRKRGMAALAV